MHEIILNNSSKETSKVLITYVISPFGRLWWSMKEALHVKSCCETLGHDGRVDSTRYLCSYIYGDWDGEWRPVWHPGTLWSLVAHQPHLLFPTKYKAVSLNLWEPEWKGMWSKLRTILMAPLFLLIFSFRKSLCDIQPQQKVVTKIVSIISSCSNNATCYNTDEGCLFWKEYIENFYSRYTLISWCVFFSLIIELGKQSYYKKLWMSQNINTVLQHIVLLNSFGITLA